MAAEVHFHGYDIHRDVAPGHPARFVVLARLEGSYSIELEGRNQVLARVTVHP